MIKSPSRTPAPPFKHGLFTYAVLEALGDKFAAAAHDGNVVYVNELYQYTHDRLPKLLVAGPAGGRGEQVPKLWSPQGENFPVAKKWRRRPNPLARPYEESNDNVSHSDVVWDGVGGRSGRTDGGRPTRARADDPQSTAAEALRRRPAGVSSVPARSEIRSCRRAEVPGPGGRRPAARQRGRHQPRPGRPPGSRPGGSGTETGG